MRSYHQKPLDIVETVNLLEALKRCETLLQAASDFITKNRLQDYTAVWDEAECDGHCFIEDAKYALADARFAIHEAETE